MSSVVDEIWRSPLARFAVHSVRRNDRDRVDGAVGREGVVWQPAGAPERRPERRAQRHPDSLATVLAEIIGLGPRPAPFPADTGDRLSWPEVVEAAGAGTLHIVLWRPDGDAERTAVVVIDAGGYALVVPADEPRRYRIEPVSPPLVWAALCGLLVRLATL
jgi:hypothetical protein